MSCYVVSEYIWKNIKKDKTQLIYLTKAEEEYSVNITTKQFQILTDINLVWDFFVDIYDRDNGGGVAAPFYEYAVQSSWMDTTYQYLNRFWFDGDKVVGFVFNEFRL